MGEKKGKMSNMCQQGGKKKKSHDTEATNAAGFCEASMIVMVPVISSIVAVGILL